MGQPSKESKDKWLRENKDKRPSINKACRLRTFYGITVEEYKEMLEQQHNKCAICGIEFGEIKDTTPHVDHNHSSGFVRGLTCGSCNAGLGFFKDDIDVLEKAIEYLIVNATPTEFNIDAARERCKIKPSEREYTAEGKSNLLKSLVNNKRREGVEPWNKGTPWSEDMKVKLSKSAKKRFESSEQRELARLAGIKGAAKRWNKEI